MSSEKKIPINCSKCGKFVGRNGNTDTTYDFFNGHFIGGYAECAICIELNKVEYDANNPPDGKPGYWTRKVACITNFGNVFELSFYHKMNDKESSFWARCAYFEDNEKIVKWRELNK